MLRTFVALVVARLARLVIRWFRPGGGSSVPGRIAAAIQPRLVVDAVRRLPMKSILVTGSAGKSSTTKFLVELLRAHGLKVFTNPSTSNIKQGFFSAVLTTCDLRGRLNHDIAVIEADEGHGPALAGTLSPQLSVFTNLMSDQLDRFVDPEIVSTKLLSIAQESSEILINADDPNLVILAEDADKPFSSIGSLPKLQSSDTYPSYAYVDRKPALVHSSELNIVECNLEELTVSFRGETHNLRLVSPGMHMALNMTLAIAAALKILGAKFDWKVAQESFEGSEGVFARWESLIIRGVPTRLALVQNPGSFTLNLNLVKHWPERVFIGVGRDVHDPSWLWTVDFSKVRRVDVIGGFNSPEAAARIKTSGARVDAVISEIPEAVETFLSLPVTEGGERLMFITADAMRRIRRHLRLAK